MYVTSLSQQVHEQPLLQSNPLLHCAAGGLGGWGAGAGGARWAPLHPGGAPRRRSAECARAALGQPRPRTPRRQTLLGPASRREGVVWVPPAQRSAQPARRRPRSAAQPAAATNARHRDDPPADDDDHRVRAELGSSTVSTTTTTTSSKTAMSASSSSARMTARPSAARPAMALLAVVALGLGLVVQAAPSPGAGEDAGGVFFPLRNVELKVYVDGKTGNLLPPPSGVILSPGLTSDAGVREEGAATFRLTDPASPGQSPALPWLSVDAKTGLLKVKAQRVLTDNGARRQHVVWLDARAPIGSKAPAHRSARPFMVPAERARLNVTITFELLQEDRPCANKPEGSAVAPEDPCHYCHDACFWQNAELQIWENKPPMLVAPLGHVLSDVQCGDRPQYTLKNGTDFFEIREGQLYSRASLDREAVQNSSAALSIECRTAAGAVEQRVVPVHVLDEDDNAPELAKEEKLEFNFSTEALLARGAHITVKDMDSRAANRFSELQVADPSGVVAHKKLEFDVTHGGVQHTIISIRLQLKDPIESHYNVTVTLTDLTLRDGAAKDLRMDATLWGPPLTPPVAMSSSKTDAADPAAGAQSAGRRRRDATPTTAPLADGADAGAATDADMAGAAGAALPGLHSATTWARAARFARLLQLGQLDDGLAYRLADGAPAWAGVTEHAGILYVRDPKAMQGLATGQPHTVFVEVLSADGTPTPGHHVNVTLRALSALRPANATKPTGPDGHTCDRQANQTCGQYTSKKACTSSCGMGAGGAGSTGQGNCVWREYIPNDVVSRNYATCSPHLGSCPDTVCDPLEQLDPNICPQDCTDKVLGGIVCKSTRFNHTENRGLCGCKEVSECYEDYCQCVELNKSGPAGGAGKKGKNARTNKSAATTAAPANLATNVAPPASCGTACQGILMVVFVALIICVALYSLYFYRNRQTKRGGPSFRLEGEYLRGTQLEVLRTDNNNTLRHTSNVDPRWEVPRCQLQLHEEIGAGEFGRVLRGTLTTDERTVTVAVKTLRASALQPAAAGPDGLPPAELRDLLSELELLKDVEHPNVIRLLGACTDSAGPPCVLLEYCALGALRGYLHGCRWADDEAAAEAAAEKAVEAEQTQQQPQQRSARQRPFMTPRKIIGFAWQIAKGMDYLGQLKLVHRDLASRNVLLTDTLVCKISDFGLSRDVYVDEAYCKLSAGKVPVKWMAPESLLMRVYTGKSDVWSFGVLLWELCTLGGAPYSGVAPHDMVALLAAGRRLARPPHCSRELYRVMQGCWQSEPQERPNFAQLVHILDGMLASGSGYLDLDARMVMNPEYFEEQPHAQLTCPPCAEGYLVPASSAAEQGPRSPRYENAGVT